MAKTDDAAEAADDDKEDKEEKAWEKLIVKLVSLRGDLEVEALLADKHKELGALAVPLDFQTGAIPPDRDGTTEVEAREAWFRKSLGRRKSAEKHERRKFLKLMSKALSKIAAKYGDAEHQAITSCDALKDGGPQEGPLICHRLHAGLAGTRFEGLRIAKEKAGIYQLGSKHLVAVQADLEGGELLVHGYFDEGNVLHPVRTPVLAFLEEHGGKPPKDQCDMFGGGAGGGGPGGDAKAAGKPSSQGQKNKAAPASAAGAAQEGSSKRSRELPPGWQKRESRSQAGVYYYVNESKGLSQFVRPEQ